jgi:uncharacterized protein
MPQIVQQGQVNLAALNVPDIIVQIVPPQLLINGVPSNIIGAVGTASWGPTNVPTIVGGYQNYTAQFGNPMPRKYDLGSFIYAATQQGASAFRCVRVTDGTDVAAQLVLQTNGITVTSLYTGSLGSTINFSIGSGSQQNSYRAIVSMGANVPEVFDNITEGVVNFTVTPGSYTVCPNLITIAAPNNAGGTQAVAYPQLVMTGSGTIGGTMAGYVVNDQVTFADGVTIKVLSVTGGAIATFSTLSTGSVPAGQSVPSGAMAQSSTTGVGTGATLTATGWGLGQPTIGTSGSGYYGSAPTVSLVGGTGSAGSLTANLSYWPNMAAAINNGISGLRGPSQRVTATAGSSTATPLIGGANLGASSVSTTWASYVTGTNGTDGANPAVIGQTGTPALIGQDAIPRTGMYALRASLVSIAALVDCDDSTTYTSQVAFGMSEAIYMVATGPNGQSVSSAITALATFGIDNFTFKLMLGDWCYINDPITGAQRMISPQGFVCGVMGNQVPSESPLNYPMNGIVATQKSQTGIQYTGADLQALSAGRVDVICNPCPGGNYFGCRLGINTSSNLSVNGDNYTRLTYFLARTIAQGCGSYVGQLQTPTERYEAQTTIASFLANLKALGLIGTADGSACYSVQINDANNPETLVALGYQIATVQVTYFSVIRYFIVNLQGGQSVVITDTLPTTQSVVNAQNPSIG